MKMLTKKLILASNSPRRATLLKEMGFEFEIRTKPTEEFFPEDLSVEEVAGYLSKKKAMAFYGDLDQDELLIAADTVVIFEEKIFGKPIDEESAYRMLSLLSGRTHRVISGVTILGFDKSVSFQDVTKVHFKSLTDDEILYYINTFQPFDKAGAYGIQEWIGLVAVEKIEGSYFTVMGLPVHKVYEHLMNWE